MELKIGLLPGDGIGPEVIKEAVKVLDSIANKFNHKIFWNEGLVGAAAIDVTGDPYPDETHKICLNSDAVLFGAVGDPKYDNDPTAKIRPGKAYPNESDELKNDKNEFFRNLIE